MKIQIKTILAHEPTTVELADVGACYPDDDVIYFNNSPFLLHSASPVIEASDEQINELIASLFDGFYPWSEDELVSMRPLVRNWLAALNQPPAPSLDCEGAKEQ